MNRILDIYHLNTCQPWVTASVGHKTISRWAHWSHHKVKWRHNNSLYSLQNCSSSSSREHEPFRISLPPRTDHKVSHYRINSVNNDLDFKLSKEEDNEIFEQEIFSKKSKGISSQSQQNNSKEVSLDSETSRESSHDDTFPPESEIESFVPPWRRSRIISSNKDTNLAENRPTQFKKPIKKVNYEKLDPPLWLQQNEGKISKTRGLQPGFRAIELPATPRKDQGWRKTEPAEISRPKSYTRERKGKSEKVRLPWDAADDQEPSETSQGQIPLNGAFPWLDLNQSTESTAPNDEDEISFEDRRDSKPTVSKSGLLGPQVAGGRTSGWRDRYTKPEKKRITEEASWKLQGSSEGESLLPWNLPQVEEKGKTEKINGRERPPSIAELSLSPDELARLRELGWSPNCPRLKVGRAGVTAGIAEFCHTAWRTEEVVRVKCLGEAGNNMRATCFDLEEMTGGMVVWRSGMIITLYRGPNYVPLEGRPPSDGQETLLSDENGFLSHGNKEEFQWDLPSGPDILEGLGPRVERWKGRGFPPVDGDWLVEHGVDNYEKPFRMLPYGARATLTNTELTAQRKAARKLNPHFLLGKNRGLEGLAAAILKLWDQTEVVKIQIKRDVQNTSNERMADELRRLTGGILLARDKFFISFHRGKDFLPSEMAATLRERHLKAVLSTDDEERNRLIGFPGIKESTVEKDIENLQPETLKDDVQPVYVESSLESSPSGTYPPVGSLQESLLLKKKFAVEENVDVEKRKFEALQQQKRDRAKAIERKLLFALEKLERANLEVAKLDVILQPAAPPKDRETITEEERYMFIRLGTRMKQYLEMGRRGVFSGVVENMHLHWKHRELVKVICKDKEEEKARRVAEWLETESGGVFVGAIPLKRGFRGLLFYRGKNYTRPTQIRPKTLLTKRQALKRSKEEQRREALEQHIQRVHTVALQLRRELTELGGTSDPSQREVTGDINEAIEKALRGPEPSVIEEFRARRNAKKEAHEKLKAERAARVKAAVKGPLIKAKPLGKEERLILREEALKMGRRATFQIGRSNVVSGLARAVRMAFLQQHLVKVGIRGRAPGTPVEDIIEELEKLTGGVFVSREPNKVILYRGYGPEQEPPLDLCALDSQETLPQTKYEHLVREHKIESDHLEESENDGEGWEDEFYDVSDPTEEVISQEIEDVFGADEESSDSLESFMEQLEETQ